MKNTTLLIMAAGIGSRFGGGIKQLEPVGRNDEIIMDYSIHDAIEAGFNKIIFVIRKDIERILRNGLAAVQKKYVRDWAWKVLMFFRRRMRCQMGLMCRREG